AARSAIARRAGPVRALWSAGAAVPQPPAGHRPRRVAPLPGGARCAAAPPRGWFAPAPPGGGLPKIPAPHSAPGPLSRVPSPAPPAASAPAAAPAAAAAAPLVVGLRLGVFERLSCRFARRWFRLRFFPFLRCGRDLVQIRLLAASSPPPPASATPGRFAAA